MKPEAAPIPSRRFDTTHWSVVVLAGKAHLPESTEALEKLCRTYWFPLYAFVRQTGVSEQDAEDLTQQFFARLLEKNYLDTVDQRKGKFRSFLLASLTHFLSNQRDHDRAAKRGSGQTILSLDEIKAESKRYSEPSSTVSPDKIFDLNWAMTVLEQALARMRQEMTADGKGPQFELLKAYLTDDPARGDYETAATSLATTPQTIAVTVFRLRQRYRELVRTEVANTVCNPLEIDEEMRHLSAALSQ